uniref:BHLH domain-containing protein n=1 Tax=Kalanchoe fedtschenkoi TaxID=63787 RepID=A0A7N0TSI5_KALFE
MFPSSSESNSSSSYSQPSMAARALNRNASVPADSLHADDDNNNHHRHHDFSPFLSPPHFNLQPPPYHQYFSADSPSNCKVNNLNHHPPSESKRLQRSGSGSDDFSIAANLKIGASSSSPPLARRSSTPAGFVAADSGGFSVPRGSSNYSRGNSSNGPGTSRLKPPLSSTRQDSNMSQLSGIAENIIEGLNHSNGHRETHNYAYANDAWDNGASITFSGPPSKRNKNEVEYLNSFTGLEHQFSLPQTTLEMATVEKLLQIPEDSVPCKIRAKRGYATHPRSIAERERRTRISGKLKKLQDLVPNMDKQTSYADMLDLAVQHIKGLQNQVQKLNKDMENCTCGCKRSTS